MPDLESVLRDLSAQQERLVQLEAVATSLARRPAASKTTTVRRAASAEGAGAAGPGFTLFRPEGEQVLADQDDEEYSGRKDLSPFLPATATMALLRFSGDAGGDTVALTIDVRPGTDGAWTRPLHIKPIQGTADTTSNDNDAWVLLDGLAFDYQVTTILNPNWSISLIGYA